MVRPPQVSTLHSCKTSRHYTLCCVAVVGAMLAVAGCDKSALSNAELAQQQEDRRLKDQKDRADLADRMRAEAIAQEKKQEPIKKLQSKIEALDEQISYARQRGKDWRALEREQDALLTQKEELERQ